MPEPRGPWGLPPDPGDAERDARDEISHHLESQSAEHEADGHDAADARRLAARRFGDRRRVERELVELHRRRATRQPAPWLVAFVTDVGFAARAVTRRPRSAALVVVTLGLGIGATTAVFNLASRLLLAVPPGVHAPEDVVSIRFGPRDEVSSFPIRHADLEMLRASRPGVRDLMARAVQDVHVAVPGAVEPTRRPAELITSNYAEVLGLRAQRGRVPGPADRAEPRVAMISAVFWRDAFSRAPDVLGRALLINGQPFVIVGVAPDGFRGLDVASETDVWVLVEAHRDVVPGVDWFGQFPAYFDVLGRLEPESDEALVQARLADTMLRAAEADSSSSFRLSRSRFTPETVLVPRVDRGLGLHAWIRGQLGNIFGILGVVVAALLLLACANAANLLLSRVASRRAELAVRRALGASRSRLVRQLLAEAALLALGGGLAGLLFAAAGVAAFRGERMLVSLPAIGGLQLDTATLAFAAGLSLVTGLVVGVLPALVATGRVTDDLRVSSSRTTGRFGPSRALVALQVALSLMLVVGAGLLLSTARELRSSDAGIDAGGVLEATVNPGLQGYEDAAVNVFLADMLGRVRRLPDVATAGLSWVPFFGNMSNGSVVRPEGLAIDDERAARVTWNHVTDGLIGALGMELVEGRDFRPEEVFSQTPAGVVILTESAARQVFPDGPAIGRRISMGRFEPAVREVVGVVRDVRSRDIRTAEHVAFEPMGQNWVLSWATVYARGREGRAPEAAGLRSVVEALDSTLPLYDVQPVARRIDVHLSVERVLARVGSILALLSLTLAAVGVYGVMAVTVQRRGRELAIRLALGATPRAVRGLVMRHGLAMAGAGLIVGLAGSAGIAQVVASRLWGVSPFEPAVYLAGTATIAVAALAACWLPARRVTRIEPTETLRAE